MFVLQGSFSHPIPIKGFMNNPAKTSTSATRAPIQKPLVIVPTYNEADNVLPLARRVFEATPDIHVLFVDDNSKDGTRERIAELMTHHPGRVHILKRAGKLGLGTAYIEGFKWALAQGYDALIEMDADHSHDPKELAVFIQKLGSYDASWAAATVREGPPRTGASCESASACEPRFEVHK